MVEYIFRGYLGILFVKTKGKRILLCELKGVWCFLASCQRKLYYSTFIRGDGCENKKEGLLHDFNTVPSKIKAEKKVAIRIMLVY